MEEEDTLYTLWQQTIGNDSKTDTHSLRDSFFCLFSLFYFLLLFNSSTPPPISISFGFQLASFISGSLPFQHRQIFALRLWIRLYSRQSPLPLTRDPDFATDRIS
jgi:hypothetical protein